MNWNTDGKKNVYRIAKQTVKTMQDVVQIVLRTLIVKL